MKLNKYVRFYFNEPDDAGGAALFDDVGDDVTPAPAPEPTPAPAAPVVDAKAIATELGGVLKDFLPKSEPAKPQLTPEEAKRLLKVWDPDDKWFQEFDNMDGRKNAILSMRDGLLAQFSTLAQAQLEQLRDEIEQRYSPIATAVAQREAAERETRFHTKYEGLKAPAFRPIISAVTQHLVQSGQKFASEEEAFDAVAKGVESVIQQTNPEFKLQSTSSAAKTRPSGGIPVTTPGASGGTSGGGGSGGKTPKAVSFLPQVRAS